MNYEKRFVLGCILGLTFMIGAIIYERTVKRECALQIVLQNGDTYTARRVNFYSSGFSDLQTCDGKRMTLHTSSIDTIINLK